MRSRHSPKPKTTVTSHGFEKFMAKNAAMTQVIDTATGRSVSTRLLP